MYIYLGTVAVESILRLLFQESHRKKWRLLFVVSFLAWPNLAKPMGEWPIDWGDFHIL
jgi:hypothetical protein